MTTDVRRIDRKQNGNFDVYSDSNLVGMPEDNPRAYPMMTKDSVGWKETKGKWSPEVPPPGQNYLRRTKVEKEGSDELVAALITPMTVLHQQHNGDLQRMKDKFAVASKGIVLKIKNEDDIPKIHFDIEQKDLGDDVADVTIKCDEPLAASTGVDIKKIDTGFPGAVFGFSGRAGNISTLKANVDTAEVEKSVQDQIEAMAKVHAAKNGDTDINPYITFTVVEFE